MFITLSIITPTTSENRKKVGILPSKRQVLSVHQASIATKINKFQSPTLRKIWNFWKMVVVRIPNQGVLAPKCQTNQLVLSSRSSGSAALSLISYKNAKMNQQWVWTCITILVKWKSKKIVKNRYWWNYLSQRKMKISKLKQ